MMSVLKFLVAVALLLFEHVRGAKTVSEVKQTGNSFGSLKGFAVRGYEIAIYCHRKEYRVAYDRWYMPNRTFFTFRIFSVVSNDAPLALRQACELDVTLPALVSARHFPEVARRVQVNAYLDLLERRMLK